jgi:hypothetical protein
LPWWPPEPDSETAEPNDWTTLPSRLHINRTVTITLKISQPFPRRAGRSAGRGEATGAGMTGGGTGGFGNGGGGNPSGMAAAG